MDFQRCVRRIRFWWLAGTDASWPPPENNLDSAPDELDLHGLYVKEAIEKTDQAIIAAQGRGDDHIRIITGKVSWHHSLLSLTKIDNRTTRAYILKARSPS